MMYVRSQRALILVLEHVGNFGVTETAAWLQPPWRQYTLYVCSNLMPQDDQCFQNVASVNDM